MSQSLDFWRSAFPTPLRDLGQIQRQMDRFLEDWVSPRTASGARADVQQLAFNPTCEVHETKEGYQLKFDLPGVSKDQIKIELHENTLTVAGERKEEKKEEDKERKRHVSEVYYGSFMRSFTFPQTVDAERVEARYDNGVLQVQLTKVGATKARQIAVK